MDGCRFDSWKEFFDYRIWEKNLGEVIPNWEEFMNSRSEGDIMPWSVIDTGFGRVIDAWRDRNLDLKNYRAADWDYNEEIVHDQLEKSMETFMEKYTVKCRARIRFRKMGSARFISHLDFIEIIKRALRMNNVPVAFTQGFNKRERMSMSFPCPLGIESSAELCDIELYDGPGGDLVHELSSRLPDGIDAVDWHYFEGKEALMAITAGQEYSVKINNNDRYGRGLDNIKAEIVFTKKTKKGEREISFKDAVFEHAVLPGNELTFKLNTGTENSMRIDNLLMALAEVSGDMFFEFRVVRTGQFRKEDDRLLEI